MLKTVTIFFLIIMIICDCFKRKKVKRVVDSFKQQLNSDPGYYMRVWLCIIESICGIIITILLIINQIIYRHFKDLKNFNIAYIALFLFLIFIAVMSGREAWIAMSEPEEQFNKEEIKEK